MSWKEETSQHEQGMAVLSAMGQASAQVCTALFHNTQMLCTRQRIRLFLTLALHVRELSVRR
jgi:hypothetical protein